MLKRIKESIIEVIQGADLILLGLCCTASLYGIAMIFSATRYNEDNRKVLVQTAALLIGIVVYFAISMIDLELLMKRWKWIAAFNAGFILLLLTPFGREQDGNRAWLKFPFLPVSIGPVSMAVRGKTRFEVLLIGFYGGGTRLWHGRTVFHHIPRHGKRHDVRIDFRGDGVCLWLCPALVRFAGGGRNDWR